MRVADLLSILREEYLDDNVEPYKWSDPYLLRLLTIAQEEATRRAKLILDRTSATAADVAEGSATSTLASSLVDTAATFVSAQVVGKTVYNTTDNTFATVSAFVDVNTLTLSADIMASGEEYIIGDPASALTRINILSGVSIYPMSGKSLKIAFARTASDSFVLECRTEGWLDRNWSGWRTASGSPLYYIEEKGYIKIVPTPDVNINGGTGSDCLLLEVFRLPLLDLAVSNNMSPEVPSEYHISLLDHVCALAYAKQDADTYDSRKAMYHATAFAQSFGNPVSAVAEENIRRLPTNFKLDGPRF